MNSPIYLLNNQESERLIFRPIENSDFDTWLEFCAYPDSLKYIFSQKNLELNVEERCRFWFNKVFHRYANQLGGMNALIEKKSGAFVGQCGLLVQFVDGIQELEIGYSLMPAFRKKGYAIEAASTCKEFAFKNKFAESLISIIHVDNKESAAVARANGMKIDKEILYEGDPVHIYRIHSL